MIRANVKQHFPTIKAPFRNAHYVLNREVTAMS